MAINDNPDDLGEQGRPYYRNDPDAPRTLFSPGPPHASQSLNVLGLWLFIAALSMFFAGSLLIYIYIRADRVNPGVNSPINSTPLHVLHFPNLLYVSTAIVIAVSVVLHKALTALRREHQPSFRRLVWIAFCGATLFVLVQIPAMLALVQSQEQLRDRGNVLYNLVFVLILVHALHVAGGMIVLWRLSSRASAGLIDHENAYPVRNAAIYWHFLDVVWITMFLTFRIMG